MSEISRTEWNTEYMKCGQKTTRKSLSSRCQCTTSIIDTEVKSAKTVVYSRKQDGNEESVFHLCIFYAKDIVNISSVRKNNAYIYICIYIYIYVHAHTHTPFDIQKYSTGIFIQ